MITEQIILSLYTVLLLEVGLLLLIIILIVLNIKKSLDSIHQLIQKFLRLGHITADTAEELKSKLTSLSGITSILGSVSEIMSLFKGLSTKVKDKDTEDDTDTLDEALSKVPPKRKRRII